MTQTLFIAALAVPLLLTGLHVQAQLSWGVRAGANASKLGYKMTGNAEKPDYSPLFSPQAGLVMNTQFGKVSIQPSLLYTRKGGHDEVNTSIIETVNGETGIFASASTYTYHLNYLELPVHLVYSTNGAKGGFQVFAGPYVAMGLNGSRKVKSSISYTDSQQSYAESGEWEDRASFNGEYRVEDRFQVRRWDAGINFGLGYKTGPIQAQLGYGLGLASLYPEYTRGEKRKDRMRNRALELSVAYFML